MLYLSPVKAAQHRCGKINTIDYTPPVIHNLNKKNG
jgi:hypothetical protein